MAIIKFLRSLTDHLVTLSVDFLVDFSFAKAHLSSPLTFEVLPLRKYWKICNEIWLQWSVIRGSASQMNKWKKYTSTNGTSQSKGKTDWVGGHFEKAKAAHAATLSVKIMSCRSFTKPGALYNVHDLSTCLFATSVPCWATVCVVQVLQTAHKVWKQGFPVWPYLLRLLYIWITRSLLYHARYVNCMSGQ